MPTVQRSLRTLAVAALAAAGALPAPAADGDVAIRRAAGAITVDGSLGDPGWKDAAEVTTWFETNPGDNVPPSVRNRAWLAYDDRFLYAAFDFEDPEPARIRAPLGDRDNVPAETDYAGLIISARNDGKTAAMFLANPRGIQYDAVSDDASSEDSSPDFFWDSAGRITDTGWTLEMRIPFSSLRYGPGDPQTWGLMLYRNYPRAYRYQMFSTRLPRGRNCFICSSARLTGLRGLPGGGHVVMAPYASAARVSRPEGDLGSPLRAEPADGELGLDVKWTPNANTAIDGTLNPDFSQVESDTAQIGANERFALFFPEKRPFFLEGIELFSTPIQAVYTRTITDPRFGLRSTGKVGQLAYTALVSQDRGGGSVILPGPEGSDLADQDFRSWVGIARLRRDFGPSFLSFLASGREVEGGGHNRVLGPDFQWHHAGRDKVTGQLLFSQTATPDRPELAGEWDGRSLSGHAFDFWAHHSTRSFDAYGEVKDISGGFRADNGFIPQVGYRQTYAESGRTFRPQGLLRRVRVFGLFDRSTNEDGDLLNRQVSFGAGMDGRKSSFLRLRWAYDRIRTGEVVLPRHQLVYTFNMSPSRRIQRISLEGYLGQDIDFTEHRRGRGANVVAKATLRPTNHLELLLNSARRWLDVEPSPGAPRARLFTAQVQRLRATWTFSSRSYLRGIAQYVDTRRDPALYSSARSRRDAGWLLSGLFAYKLNWQTVFFLGYGDDRELTEDEQFAGSGRQFFAKISYAFQR